MATIVRHKETEKRYILLGSGLGIYQSKNPGFVLSVLFPKTEQGGAVAICVCDEQGDVRWFDSSDIVVETVDGQDPHSLLD
jgi:hypothetical protein